MAKKPKNKSDKAAAAPSTKRRGVSVATVGGVTISGPAAKSYVSRIENLFDDLASLKSEYMNACKPIHEDIKSIYQEVKAAGIDTRAMKATVEVRALERRAAKKRDDLRTTEEQNAFDAIRMAMGDFGNTPLGAATAAAEARTQTGPNPEEGEDDEGGGPARADEASLSGVGRGGIASASDRELARLTEKYTGQAPQATTPPATS